MQNVLDGIRAARGSIEQYVRSYGWSAAAKEGTIIAAGVVGRLYGYVSNMHRFPADPDASALYTRSLCESLLKHNQANNGR